MKGVCFWPAWILTLMLLTASAPAGTMNITDMAGRKVTTPFDPERIICIGPGALRLIVYLEAEEKVVGVEDMEKLNPSGRPYWIAHPEFQKLPRCGPGGPAGINKKPDLETVLCVNPQVIFVTYMDGPLADKVQGTLGIPVVVLSYGSFATFDEAVYDAFRVAGKILNRERRAHEVVKYIETLRKDLHERRQDIPEDQKPGVYIGGIGYRGSYGIESTEQRFTPFEWVHANNLAEGVKASIGSHVFLDKEMLLKMNPDIIFIDAGGLTLVAEDYRKRPEYYHALKAFQNRQVYRLLPFNWYTTNIGTALADAYAVGKIIYGPCYKDVDPEQKADEIYSFLVGKPVYRNMKKDYGPLGGLVSLSE